jgi:hypothetical protein
VQFARYYIKGLNAVCRDLASLRSVGRWGISGGAKSAGVIHFFTAKNKKKNFQKLLDI